MVIEVETMPDHVHLLVELPPQVAVSDLVKILKGRSSRRLRQEFAHLASIRGSTPLRRRGVDFFRDESAGQRVSAGLSSFSCGVRSGLSAGGQGVAVSGGLWPMVLRHSASQ